MTGPTREDVERLAAEILSRSDANLRGFGYWEDAARALAAENAALRERLEAAEAERLLMAQRFDEGHPDPALMAKIIMQNIESRFSIEDLRKALTESRAREAAAWDSVKSLEKAVSEVSRCGAQTGSQWSRLTIALLKARAALNDAATNEKDN